ncbi:putative hydrolase of the HAD superfamily [Sulfurivirga caldicuralii]|uniref:Putative hydrolase of the HAD superfamily n=1 Tax=Sulfurivirga caldicuralii TaxID=364032 RepID=A0A1N6GBF0_9GAMM|nr:GMP/IMP nucleotidase [Sulfurivirga caldicuralii]SIO04880.1 putative hydrolase of the HAD superfamily [Sulfurivirga caldicuralii]
MVKLPWEAIDTVLLDMDGTLLDLYFDWHFWRDYLPRLVAEKEGLPLEAAREKVTRAIEVKQGTLEWYCTDYWSQVFDLPVAQHKHDLKHLIRPHAGVETFLQRLRALGKRLALVTNAHRDSLMLKLEQTAIGDHFDTILCAHDYGMPKEDARIWAAIRRDFSYNPVRTLLIDDNIHALQTAQQYGIRHLLAASHVSPHMPPVDPRGFPSFHSFDEIMPPAP